jgi:hypothetical protein
MVNPEDDHLAQELDYPEHQEYDISFRSFNAYMFRSTLATLPLVLLLITVLVTVILIDQALH